MRVMRDAIDLPAVMQALESGGFVYRRAAGLDLFLDGADVRRPKAARAAGGMTTSLGTGKIELSMAMRIITPR